MRRFFPYLFLIAGLSPDPCFGGAFPLAEGQGQMISGVGYIEAPRTFDSSGKAVAAPAFRKDEAASYLAYGLTNDVTLIVAPALVRMSAGAPAVSYTGSDGSAIGLQFRLYSTPTQALSLQVLAEPRIGSGGSEVALGGPNLWAAHVALQAGQAFRLWGLDGFLDLEPGTELRGGGFSSEARFDLAAGFRPAAPTLVLLQDYTRVAPRAGPMMPSLAANTLQLSLVQDLSPRWSIQLGAMRTLAGRNVAVETGPVAAIWLRF